MIGYFETEYKVVGVDIDLIKRDGEMLLRFSIGVGTPLTQLTSEGQIPVMGADGNPIIMETGMVHFTFDKEGVDSVLEHFTAEAKNLSNTKINTYGVVDLTKLDEVARKLGHNK